MGRLTRKNEQGNWHLKGVPWERLRAGAELDKATADRIYGALCKLLAYEDTGLEPAEVEYAENLYETLCAKLLERLMEEQGKHRWIPVEERLPERGERIIVCTEHGFRCEAIRYGIENEEIFGQKIVAWMPLPEQYRQEETKST